MTREEDIQTVRASAVYGIPVQYAFPPTQTVPIRGIPIPLRRCRPTYRLVECRQRGCKTLLPDDLVWCYFHKPDVTDISYISA